MASSQEAGTQTEQPSWTEQFDLEKLDPRFRESFERFLLQREINLAGYRNIPEDRLDESIALESISPRKELIHQIKNTLMRRNILLEMNQYDFRDYPAMDDSSRDELCELLERSTHDFFDSLLQENDAQEEKTFDKGSERFRRQITREVLISSAHQHEVLRSDMMIKFLDYFSIPRLPQIERIWG